MFRQGRNVIALHHVACWNYSKIRLLSFFLVIVFRQITKELQNVLSQDPYPKTRLANGTLPDSVLKGLTHFGLVTHGFGSPAFNAALNSFQSYLNELLKCHETLHSNNNQQNGLPKPRNQAMKNGDV